MAGPQVRNIVFFPLLLAGIGGLSILSIAETLLARNDLFAAPVRWLIDGYERIAALAGSLFEPLLNPVVRAVGGLFATELSLQPHWRALFILGLTIATSVVSVTWRTDERWFALRSALVLGAAALLGAAIAGVAPLELGPLAHGLAAAAPTGLIVLAMHFGPAAAAVERGDRQGLRRVLNGSLEFSFSVAALAFMAGALLALVPAFRQFAGFLALALAVMVFGGGLALLGSFGDRHEARTLGLRILSGFIAAVLILVANGVLKVLDL